MAFSYILACPGGEGLLLCGNTMHPLGSKTQDVAEGIFIMDCLY